MIEVSQRWVAAANIAADQAEAGDLDGALATFRSSPDQARSVSGIAYSLAARGRLPMALQLIAATPDGDAKAVAYLQVAGALVEGARYDDALSVARLISEDANETDRFLDGLLRIYAAQWKAGGRQGASATLGEALRAVKREPDVPPGLSKPLPVAMVFSHRPRMYQRIVYALVLAGNRDGALPVVDRISAMAARERNPDRKKGILGPLAQAQAERWRLHFSPPHG
jgi:tetratricopeptide (TPR) repeat protein